MFRTLCASIALFAGCFAGLSSVKAQDIQNFRPATGAWDYLTVDSARVQHHFEFVPSLVYSYAHRPLEMEYNPQDKRLPANITVDDLHKNVIEDLHMAHLMLSLGVEDFLSFAVDMPFAWVSGEVIDQYNDGSFALGDLRLHAKVNLYGLEDYKNSTGWGAAAALMMNFPTGDNAHMVGEAFSSQIRLIGERKWRLGSMALNLGFKLRTQMQKYESLELGNEYTYGLAGAVNLFDQHFAFIADLFGVIPAQDVFEDSASNPLEMMGGFRWISGKGPVLTAAAGTSVISDYGAAQWRLMFGFTWHAQRYDLDGDGVVDELDLCPDEPEDIDGYEDEDGCPDPDNDQDGIPDVFDKCPNEPEDRDGFEDEDGCPDPDNDQDGILDIYDRCPNQPEVINGYQDEDGCPDSLPDHDNDGIPDQDDKCPDEPETYNHYLDDDGCPDTAPRR